MEVLVFVGTVISLISVIPLVYLALRSVHEAHELRQVQHELAMLMRSAKDTGEEVHQLQRVIRREQKVAVRTIEETKRTVEEAAGQVTEAVEQTVGQITDSASEPRLVRIFRGGRRGLSARVGDTILSLARDGDAR